MFLLVFFYRSRPFINFRHGQMQKIQLLITRALLDGVHDDFGVDVHAHDEEGKAEEEAEPEVDQDALGHLAKNGRPL